MFGEGHVVLGFGGGALSQKGFEPLQADAGQIFAGLQGAQLRVFLGDIHLHEHFTGRDPVPRFKGDVHDLARSFGGQGHALHGGDRTHRTQNRFPGRAGGVGRGDHRRRHDKGFTLGDHFPDLQRLDSDQGTGHNCDKKNGKKNFFDHGSLRIEVDPVSAFRRPMTPSTGKHALRKYLSAQYAF